MLKHLGRLLICSCLIALGYFVALAIGSGAKDGAGGPGGGPPWTGGPPGAGRPGGAGPTSRPSGNPVVVATSVATTIQERVAGSGVLEAERAVTITARVAGEVDELYVEEGDPVGKDGKLCSIDRQVLEIAKSLAEAQRDRDQSEYGRQIELEKRNIASESELDAAKYAAKISQASLEQAVLDLDHSQPVSPFAGVIVTRHIEKGQYLRAGDVIFDLADFDPLRMRVFLPEAEVRGIRDGQEAELRLSRQSAIVAAGHVERVSPVVDRESLTVEVLVSFEGVPAEVRPGTFGHVDVITHTHEDVILVPRAAVLRRDDTPHVFRVQDDIAQRVEVTTGYEDDAVVVILQGLQAGDDVVVEGHRELQDHDRIKVYRRVPVRGQTLKVPATSK